MHVVVIGQWHLGLVNSVGFAKSGYTVTGIEFEKEKVSALEKGKLPLYEPGLQEAFDTLRVQKKLSFSFDPKAVSTTDYVVIAYDSPVNEKDEVDITPVVKAARSVAPYLKSNTPLVITSQIPLGTSEKIEKQVQKLNPQWKSGVVYVPENLRLGQAIERFLKPDMIVMGANNSKALASAQELYKPFESAKFTMNLRSAEMVKHALNTFLATSISFGNEIAALCDSLDADAMKVCLALKADVRIGKAPILPGLGFAGGTLARDVTQLGKFIKTNSIKAPIINGILKTNNSTYDHVIAKIEKQLGTSHKKTIGILGLTYKPGTSTMRRSPAIKVISKLVNLGYSVLGYDPKADETEVASYKKIMRRVDSIDELAIQSDALVLITEWPEFRDINWKTLAVKMKKPLIVDTKNFLDSNEIMKTGFHYVGYGR